MNFQEFVELNLPIGTKVRYKDNEWLYVGMGIEEKETYIQLARNDEKGSYPHYAYIASWRDDEIEVIEYPVEYLAPAIYKQGDIVYHYEDKCMVLRERNNKGAYHVYNHELDHGQWLDQKELTLEPRPYIVDEDIEDDEEKEKKGGE